MNLVQQQSIATSPSATISSVPLTTVRPILRKSVWGMMAAAVAVLTACSSAPPNMSNNLPQRPIYVNGVPNFYVVQSGDTLSKIATRYGLDYRRIGALNGLDSNYTIHVGQRLVLLAPNQVSQSRPTTTTRPSSPSTTRPTTLQAPIVSGIQQNWQRPVTGNLVRSFNQSSGVLGNWYSSSQGAPVVASQAGTVMYVGNDLQEYGRLVLIQHTNDLITAYAHLGSFNVQEKQTVRAGQQIGTVGYAPTINQPAVEFQVRLRGTPVNPSAYVR